MPSPIARLFDTDPVRRSAAADDFGHIVHDMPVAVVRPRSAADIQELVRHARTHRLPLAVRGRGHSTHGQCQVAGGIVIDLAEFASLRAIDGDTAWVEGGCTWATLVDAALLRHTVPPALTDYLGLSVGGTLSMGGVGGASFRHGPQTDNVLELDVVTGTGELIRCSPELEPDLFDATRAGVGLCGVIVGARVRLIRVPGQVQITRVAYPGIDELLDAQLALACAEQVDYLDGTILKTGPHELACVLTIAVHGEGGLDVIPPGQLISSQIVDHGTFAHRVQAYIERLTQLGVWNAPHPWLDLFLPNRHVRDFVRLAAAELEDERDGMVLTYLLKPSMCRTPNLALPDDDWVFLVDLLRNSTEARVDAALQRNRELTEQAVERGAGIYPIGSMPASNWRALFPAWARLTTMRDQFDPDRVFASARRLWDSSSG